MQQVLQLPQGQAVVIIGDAIAQEATEGLDRVDILVR